MIGAGTVGGNVTITGGAELETAFGVAGVLTVQGNMTVDAGSALSADARGLPFEQGPGAGVGGNGVWGGGGGHGGYGGAGISNPNSGGVAYGSINQPVTLGSGGGNTNGAGGGSGGGAIRLNITGTLTVAGRIS